MHDFIDLTTIAEFNLLSTFELPSKSILCLDSLLALKK